MGSAVRSPAQNRKIYGLLAQIRRESGLSKEDADALKLRLCVEVSGQEHSSKLTPAQAKRLIGRLANELAPRNEADRKTQRQAPPSKRGISRRQVDVLQAMFRQAGMTSQGEQMKFSRRQCGVPWPQTAKHVDKIMTPLRDIVMRGLRPRDAWKRARALEGHRLNEWEHGFVRDLIRQFQAAEADGELDRVMTTHKLRKLVEIEVAHGA